AGAWTDAGVMVEPRRRHTATLLSDGRVLVVAGSKDGVNPLASAELYSPFAGDWSSAGSISDARWGHIAVLLPEGEVLIAGGFGFNTLRTVEIYTPAGGGWSSSDRAVKLRHRESGCEAGKVCIV
ncbi:MAG TPA: branched-chain amino acid ABC transporter substrate-binding protein, partial [Dehalococcoidia bacterium]|nr:branched-chain amino acid ABC transporter substrate-binding protein [Dehalococcoidia bacterium]